MISKLIHEDFIKDIHNLYIHPDALKLCYTIKDKINSKGCKIFCSKIAKECIKYQKKKLQLEIKKKTEGNLQSNKLLNDFVQIY